MYTLQFETKQGTGKWMDMIVNYLTAFFILICKDLVINAAEKTHFQSVSLALCYKKHNAVDILTDLSQ